MSSFADLPLGSADPKPFIDGADLVVMKHPGSRYRRLRLRLEEGTPELPFQPQATVITSAIPGEGKTTTATNLALAYSEDRTRRTLLVDGDLRRPSVSRYIAPRPTIGLSEVLAGDASLDQALIEISDSRLWVLPSGAPSPTPTELLQARNLGAIIAELRRRFDRIVIDAPPTVLFTDAAVLASHADGALLVVRARTTPTPLIRRARASLAGTNVFGAVLNDVVFSVVDRYYDRYDENLPGGYAYARRHDTPS